jgi:hypothetical protein
MDKDYEKEMIEICKKYNPELIGIIQGAFKQKSGNNNVKRGYADKNLLKKKYVELLFPDADHKKISRYIYRLNREIDLKKDNVLVRGFLNYRGDNIEKFYRK